jgi:enediyne biosynthesis protein E4
MAIVQGVACDRSPPKTGTTARREHSAPEIAATTATKRRPIVFRAQDLPFRYERGDTGVAWPVETTGGGVGLLDYDGDGDLDIFFAQGGPLRVTDAKAPRPSDVLLRNDGSGNFTDVSLATGLTWKGYGQGVTVADYDGDGDPDVYVTRYGANTLWRNDGGRFVDATLEAGIGGSLWSLGAAFFDADGDGDLDLFVARYFAFDEAKAPFYHNPETGAADYGPPADYPGLPDIFYRNEGNGRYVDMTAIAGIAGKARGMGCLAADFDRDGRMDVLVANDAEENALWRNKGDGTFENVALQWGLALNGDGQSEANMGIARGDTDEDGLTDVIITHFFGEHHTLWRFRPLSTGLALFVDETNEAGLGQDSRPTTGWGISLADFDHDGHLDLGVTNGHIRRESQQKYPYENPPLLWRNRGDSRFENVTSTAGPYFQALHMGRGLAAGDLDGDGDLDLVIVHHHANSVVLWNETSDQGAWLIVDLRGAPPNTDAIGAEIKATVGNRTIIRAIDGGGSYISSHDRRIHLGLGSVTKVDRIEVRWPSGRVESRSNLPVGKVVRWAEGDEPTK